MNIREAAEALLEELVMTRLAPWTASEKELALRAALALPDAPRDEGWAEGYRAGLEAAAKAADFEASGTLDDLGRSIYARMIAGCGQVIAREIRALPVPSAPTPAPEAKTAESAHQWMVMNRRTGERTSRVFATAAGAQGWIDLFGAADAFPVRVRIIDAPEPAPVEPEETHR